MAVRRRRADVVAALRAAGCVFAEDEATLLMAAARGPEELATMVRSRAGGTPLEHILGWVDFCATRIAVEAGVFVPRQRSELLVDLAAEAVGEAASRQAAPVVVDLCCGSGAIAAALAARLDGVVVHAADVDPAAVRCARRNLAAAGGRVHQGDLYDALPRSLARHVDVLVVNAPYVPTDAIGLLPAEARLHEPRRALDGGADGLAVVRRVVAGAPRWLAHAGSLLVETSLRQAPAAVAAMEGAGLAARVVRREELDATVVRGTLPAAPGARSR